MALSEPLEPKTVSIKTLAGEDRNYVISKFPAVQGREIVANYPLTAIPTAGDYAANENVMLKLMAYVGKTLPNGTVLMFVTKELVNQHVPDYETLVKLELEMMKYNTSFFQNGEISTFLSDTAKKAVLSISPTLMASLQQLLKVAKQRLENSKPSTH